MAINRIKVSRAAEKLARQGRLDAAILEYQKLLDDSPADLATLNKVGDLHRRSGQTRRALACFQKIAEHYRDHGFVQKAIAMFKKIAKLDAGNSDTLEQLVALYIEQGLDREALRHLRLASQLAAEAGESERALELEYRALELCPDDAAAQRAVAARLREAGEVERCIASYLKAAAGYASKNQIDEAVECCHEALGAAPLDPEPAETLCRLLLAADQGARAVTEIEALLAADPETPHLFVLQGEALLSTGEPGQAREALMRARGTAVAEGNIDFHVALVRVDLAEGDGAAAIKALESVVPLLRERQRDDTARRLLCDVLKIEAGNATALRLLLEVCKGAANTDDGDGAWALLLEQLQGSDLENELAAVRQRLDRSSSAHPSAPGAGAGQATHSTASNGANDLVAEEGASSESPGASAGSHDDEPIDNEFVTEHLTEADVFIKYKLLPKAVAHLKRIIDRYPSLIVAHQRLVALYGELGETREVVYHSAALVHAHHQRGATEEARAALRDAMLHASGNESLQAMRAALRQGRPLPKFVQDQARSSVVTVKPPNTSAESLGPTEAAEAELSGAADPTSATPAASKGRGETAAAVHQDAATNAADIPAIPAPEVEVATPPIDEEVIDLFGENLEAGEPQEKANGPGEETAGDSNPAPPDGGFFDLASALEEDLARDEAEDSVVTKDSREEEDPTTGIRRAIQDQVSEDDHQTHYQLGIAFKEMGLLDEAIGEFQQASRAPENFASCCSMLGLCFREKGMGKIAEKWYRRGLEHVGAASGSDEHVGLVYDLAELHLEHGEFEKARDGFTEVFATNATYREVAARLKQVSEQSATPEVAGGSAS